MRIRRFEGTTAVLAIMLLVSGTATAQQRTAVLDDMQAVQAATQTLDGAFGRSDGTIGGVDFDEGTRVWEVHVGRGIAESSPEFLVTVDENSGAVCARQGDNPECVARDDVSPILQASRDKRTAQEEAVRNPAPDLQDLMVVLVRHAYSKAPASSQGVRQSLYVSLYVAGGRQPVDLTAESIRLLSDTGYAIEPGSAWIAPKDDAHVGSNIQVHVNLPRRRPDGDYDVDYGYYCGSLCAGWYSAVMRHDATGWHVISTVLNAIS